jgi:hypothetical protein
MRGGQASFSINDIAASPQSYLPFNNYANDPGHNMISARNTGDFLTGTVKGGRRSRGRKYRGGDDTGAAAVLSKFSSSGSLYNSSAPANIAPMA